MKINDLAISSTKVILQRHIFQPIDITYLNSLPDDSSRYKSLYKRFYKLRVVIDNDKHSINRYKEMIRWRFSKEDFNIKRCKILETQDVLDKQQVFERILNTLIFVHNSTVALPEHLTEKSPLYFHEAKESERIEKSVVLTMLKMHYKMPASIKYDRSFDWYSSFRQQLDSLPENPTKRQLRDVEPYKVGYIDYFLTLMMLNESYKLCL